MPSMRNAKGKGKLSSTSRVPPEVPLLPTLPSGASSALKVAYNRAVIGGVFIDVVFYAYSCKTASGLVCKPRPIYANSAILRAASSYFEALISREFSETKVRNIDKGFPSDKDAYTTEYDYDSDSDLESIEDEIERITEAASETMPNSPKANTETTLILDVNNTSVGASDHNVQNQGPNPARFGRVIFIPNIAYTTLRALISYIGCGNASFLPLKSSGIRRDLYVSLSEISERSPPGSPKSMYRAAVMFDLKALKTQAERDIRSKLTSKNILPELFSRFTSSYDNILKTQIRFLYQNRRSEVIHEAIPTWTARVVQGDLGHAADALRSIMTVWLKGIETGEETQDKPWEAEEINVNYPWFENL